MKPPASIRRPPARPFVFINMAMSADGKIATANREVSTFGSPADHRHMLELRATADAVMAGARTVDSGPTTMGPGGKKYQSLRLKNGLNEFNLRVIVTGNGTIDPEAEIFRHRFSPIIILTCEGLPKRKLMQLESLADSVGQFGRKQLDLARALVWLRTIWKVRRLLCEGGGELNAAMLQPALVDEIHLTLCPLLFGGKNAPTIAEGDGVVRLADAAKFRLFSQKRSGDELFMVYRSTSANLGA